MRDSIIPFCNCPLLDAAQKLLPRKLPRIVGLTASFVNGKCQNLTAKRHNLEALLLAEMWAPRPEQVLLCIYLLILFCVGLCCRYLFNIWIFSHVQVSCSCKTTNWGPGPSRSILNNYLYLFWIDICINIYTYTSIRLLSRSLWYIFCLFWRVQTLYTLSLSHTQESLFGISVVSFDV